MRRFHAIPTAAMIFTLTPAAAETPAKPAGSVNIEDSIQAPQAMEPQVEIYMHCLGSAFVATKPKASSDFTALEKSSIDECKDVRARALTDAAKALGPGDQSALANKALDSVEASFHYLNLQVRDQLIKQAGQPSQ